MSHAAFPQIFDIGTRQSHPLTAGRPTTFGYGSAADVALEPAGDEAVLFRVVDEDGRWIVERLDPATALSVDQSPTSRCAAVEHLSVIQAAGRTFVFLAQAEEAFRGDKPVEDWLVRRLTAAQLPVSARSTLSQTLVLPEMRRKILGPEGPGLGAAVPLRDTRLLIGRDAGQADICLADPRVSRLHAWIERRGGDVVVADLKSTNGTFVNGRAIVRPTNIQEGCQIQIGPYSLVFRSGALCPSSHDKNVQLAALNLVRRVPDRQAPGRLKVILDDVSLVVQPREFVCILGPSGSGKTTLLSALSARVPADEGHVLLNGDNLYAHFDSLKQNLAVVAQRDVLHDMLPLSRALWYSARLRLPADTSPQDIDRRIDETLETVDLVQHQFRPIRELSGGQAKRASWANEAISNPSLIFLDEVTSGLDEQTDSEMMQLFRRLADAGKTIVCVTHSLSYVEQNCHLVVILAPGGVLAFVGPPAGALEYFGISRLGDVYQRLREHSPEQWKLQFRSSPYYEQYVERRLPDQARLGDPRPTQQMAFAKETLVGLRQYALFTRRYLAIQWSDRRALAMMLAQSLFIALLMSWLFGRITTPDVDAEARNLAELAAPGVGWNELFPETRDEFLQEVTEARLAELSSKLLFLLGICALWFGCNNSAKEIVKERAIYSKERDVGLHVTSYFASKLTLLGVLSVLQISLLLAIVRYFSGLGGDALQQWLLLAAAAVTGAAMGLAISAIAKSEDVAVTMVPLALIPQIIFAGLIAPLSVSTRLLSQAGISAYWAYQGLLRSLPSELQSRLRDSGYLDLTEQWTLTQTGGILAAHVLIFSCLAMAALLAGEDPHRRFRRFFVKR